jgi:hypothetical protein
VGDEPVRIQPGKAGDPHYVQDYARNNLTSRFPRSLLELPVDPSPFRTIDAIAKDAAMNSSNNSANPGARRRRWPNSGKPPSGRPAGANFVDKQREYTF